MWTSAATRRMVDFMQSLHIKGDAAQSDVGQSWKTPLSEIGVWNANTGAWNLEALMFLRTHLDGEQIAGAPDFNTLKTHLLQHPEIQEWRKLTDPSFGQSEAEE